MLKNDKPKKGYIIRVCKHCRTKRHIWKLGYFWRGKDQFSAWQCSKGHRWDEEVLTAEKIGNIMQDVFLKKVSNLFDRDDTFFETIKRH